MKTTIFALAAFLSLASLAEAGAVEGTPVDLTARGWFFRADGSVVGSDLGRLGFDDPQGQPSVRASARLWERHVVAVDYLMVRRKESGTVTGEVLGTVVFGDDVAVDLEVDYVRVHYGYEFSWPGIAVVEPFLEVGLLWEDTVVENRTLATSDRSDEFVVLPLPGFELMLGPELPIQFRARLSGIGFGGDHLIDVEGGLESQIGPAIVGAGYRNIDLEFDEGTQSADVAFRGFFVEGGIRW